MTTQIITIKSVTKKESKTGKPYWSVETNDGKKLSVWDVDVAEKIVTNEGNTVEVEVLKNDKYSNIMDFNKVISKPKTQTSNGHGFDPTTMLISYAKDLTVAEITALVPKCKDLEEAVSIIKQAEKEMFTKVTGMINLMENIKNGDNQEGDDDEEDSEVEY